MSLLQNALDKAGRVAQPPAEPVTFQPSQPLKSAPASKKNQPEIKEPVKKEKVWGKSSKPTVLIFGAFIFLVAFFVFHLLQSRILHSSDLKTGISDPSTFSSMSLLPKMDADASKKFRLTGITSSGDQRLALINNQVVGIGDPLQGNAVVKEIGTDKVKLQWQGKTVELVL